VLVEKLAAKQSAERNLSPPLFSESCRKVMLRYPWPGNVRELKNIIKRFIILRPGETISGNEMDTQLNGMRHPACRKHMTLQELERAHIINTLKETGGVVGGAKGAAALLGVPRQTLQYRMRKYGISANRLAALHN
jgi:DNA-binding NtrC family response regulator